MASVKVQHSTTRSLLTPIGRLGSWDGSSTEEDDEEMNCQVSGLFYSRSVLGLALIHRSR
ncbi:MAG TPA: hypothetical protein V6D48_15670 [Oculatellaceae cyanobacterium]